MSLHHWSLNLFQNTPCQIDQETKLSTVVRLYIQAKYIAYLSAI